MAGKIRDSATLAAIDVFGSRAALQRGLNVTPQHITNWFTDGLPPKRAWQTISYALRRNMEIPDELLCEVPCDAERKAIGRRRKTTKELELV